MAKPVMKADNEEKAYENIEANVKRKLSMTANEKKKANIESEILK